MQATRADLALRHALVFAVAHEVGNHLAAVRLEAHLLDEELGAHGLAKASLAIDGVAARSAPLLALLRPLLEPGRPRGSGGDCARVVEGVKRQLEEEGTAGLRIDTAIEEAAAGACPALEGLHWLLVALVGSPEDLPADAGPIRLVVARKEGGIVVALELPGDAMAEVVAAERQSANESSGPGHGSASALRGRALAVALARVIVGDAGGSVVVSCEPTRSRVELRTA